MRNKIYIFLPLLLFSTGVFAQTDVRHIHIADTLTAQEKLVHNPVILKTELDSLIKQYNASQVQQIVNEPVKETSNYSNVYIIAGLVAIFVLLIVVIYMFYHHQKKMNKAISRLNEKEKEVVSDSGNGLHVIAKERSGKGKTVLPLLESKINDLNSELHKLSKENEGLSRVIKEYNGIQHEYDSLKHGILKAYKVKNYPGYDKSTDETSVMQAVLETENSVANYAYEKFLKPILSITDANKNSPAKLSASDREKLLDLLVSLSLLYIEHLYLRVKDLSVGGKMVERIKSFSNGNNPDVSLLKKLDTEFGSRALVIKMALNKVELYQLTYPVFDETNLNNQ